jgi:ankyrin repeat protein
LVAARLGHTELVELLLTQGAEVNDKDNDGSTALMLAAAQGHMGIVQMLLTQEGEIIV